MPTKHVLAKVLKKAVCASQLLCTIQAQKRSLSCYRAAWAAYFLITECVCGVMC